MHLIDDEDLLLRWSSRQISPDEHERIIAHLAKCSDCRKSVTEMIKSGILEFSDVDADIRQLSLTTKNRKPHSRFFILGAVMSSSLCLLICFFFLLGSPDSTNIAHNPGSEPGDGVKFRGTTDDSPQTDKFAVLVGINKYGKLKESEWLDGCHNDMDEVKAVITERFGFDPDNVTTLLDEQATAAGIRAQFRRLTETIQSRPENIPPAQVLFYFSGHGSRIPDQPEGHPDCDSPDGLDSTLVVYDSEQQGSDSDIRDDELNNFAHEICKDGKAELLICLDSCHSGGGARGITKFRGLERNLEQTTSTDHSNRKFTPKTLPNGTVFLSACQSNQKEPEYEKDGKKFGLFTCHLTQLLRSERIVSSLDYSTLKDAIHRSYQRNKIAQAPTPTVEGSPLALKKSIFRADRSFDKKPYWNIARQENQQDTVRMEAGRIDGITPKSLFELYESVEQALDPDAASLGWFSIEKTDGNYSLGRFFQWKDAERTDQIDAVLPNAFKTGFAVRRYHDYGDNILAVRVVDAVTGTILAPNHSEVPETVKSVLLGTEAKDESRWIRWVGSDENCDIVIRFDDESKYAAVFPATGRAEDDLPAAKTRGTIMPESLHGGWGPIEWGTAKDRTDLVDMLRRIMKGLSLKRLVAEKSEPLKTRGEGNEPTLRISVSRKIDDKRFEPVEFDPQRGIVLAGGENDWYRLRMKNNDVKPFFVTILCIDPNMQIAAFPCGPEKNPMQFDPEVGTNNNISANKLEAGSEFVSDFGFEAPFGLHSLVVLATREPSDFSYLEQPGLPTGKAKSRGTVNPVFEFLNDQCTIGTRAGRRPAPPRDDAWNVGTVDVIVEPGE